MFRSTNFCMLRPRFTPRRVRGLLPWALVAATTLGAGSAHAGGFYFADRGSRPLSRGGALVAGADDGNALWYNPAGLSYAKDQIFVDAVLPLLSVDFQRTHADGTPIMAGPNGGGYPEVSAGHAPLPIPLGAAILNVDDFTFAVGGFALNQVALEWPNVVTMDGVAGMPAPQRYSLLSLNGSVLANATAAVSYGTDDFSIGVAPYLVLGQVRTQIAFSGCDKALCTFPEDPGADVYADLTVPVLTFGGTAGAIVQPADWLKFGASFTLPYKIDGQGKVDLRLPNGPVLGQAQVTNDRVDLLLEFAWVLRAGIEFKATDELKVELAYVYEAWADHDALEVEPQDVSLVDVFGIDEYEVGPLSIVHDMQDVHSIRLGGEYRYDDTFTLRSGAAYENSAFAAETLSPFTPDAHKLLVGLGGTMNVNESLALEASYGHVFMLDTQVRDSRVTQPNGIRPVENAPVVANGNYAMEANLFGVGASYKF